MITFVIDYDIFNRSFHIQRSEIFSIHESMGNATETNHIDLILVANDEMIRRYIDDEPEPSTLLFFD